MKYLITIFVFLSFFANGQSTYNKIKNKETKRTVSNNICYFSDDSSGGNLSINYKVKKLNLVNKTFDKSSITPPPPTIDYVNTRVIYLNGNQSWRESIVILTDGYTVQDSALARSNGTTLFNYFKTSEFWKEYWQNYNWVVIASPSPTSGINTVYPPYTNSCVASGYPIITDKTPLYGSTFNYGGLCRLLYAVNQTTIQQVVNYYFPLGVKQTMVLANSPYYGGSGGTYATGSTHIQSSLIMRHEIGHSYAKLADEYEGYATFRNPPPSGGYYYRAWNSGDNSKPNVDTGRTYNKSKYKLYLNPSGQFCWYPQWTTNCNDFNLNICFEGGNYYSSSANNYNMTNPPANGLYPTVLRFKKYSFMQSLSVNMDGVDVISPLYAVNYEAHIYNFYLTIPTSKWLSNSTSNADTIVYPNYPTVTQQLVSPKLKAEWKVNGVVVPNLGTYNFPFGSYQITYTLKDTSWQTKNLQGNSPIVYNNYQLPTYTKTWNYKRQTVQVVTLTPFSSVCVNSAPIVLSGGLPLGGFYSGTNVTNGVFNPIALGTTFITYNYNGTSATQPIVVNSNPTAVISTSGSTSFCYGGSVGLIASGGVSYLWSNGSTSNAISNITSPSFYTVTVTDANGCTNSNSISVNVYATPIIAIQNLNTNACNNDTLSVVGADSYLWSNGSTASTIIVGSGTYSVIGTNQYGCTDSKSVTVTLNSFTTPTLNVSVSCINGATFTWSSSTCFSRYDVRQKLTTSTSWTTYNNVVSGFKTGLSGGLREAQIRVYVNGIAQSWSSSVQFNYPNYLLQLQPPTFTITQLNPTSAKVDYVVNPLLPTTNLRLKKVVNTSWTNVTVSGGTYTRNNMTTNSQYEFQMRCTCSGQSGAYSPSTYFQTYSTLRVENVYRSNISVNVYPNPFKNTLNIVSDTIGDVIIRTFDGKIIDVDSGSNITINTKDYPVGIYLLEFINSSNESASFKIIKGN